MNVLHDAVRLITQPPGDLVYFLVTLFALQQALFSSWLPRGKASTSPLAQRWRWALGLLIASRGVMILLALLGQARLINPVLVLPPLERFLDLCGILLVLWALLGARAARWQTGALIALSLLAAGFYIYSAVTWPAWAAAQQAYNGFFHELIWEVAAVALLVVGLFTLLLRPPEWEWAAGVLLFWLMGHLAQIGWPDTQLHFAGWERLTALVAFPLLAVLVQRQLASPVAATTGQSTWTLKSDILQEILTRLDTARELEPALMLVSSRLAELLNAELCAIALAEEGQPSQVRVLAVHPPTGQAETPVLNLDDYAALQTAWRERVPRAAQHPQAPHWLPALYAQLGLTQHGPLLVLPLVHQNRQVGLLLLGNPDSGRRWDPNMLPNQELTATLLAGAIDRASKQEAGVPLLSRMREQGGGERLRLEQDLEAAQAQVSALATQVTELQDERQQLFSEVGRLRAALETQANAGPSETELTIWQNEVQELIRDRDVLMEDRNRLGGQLAVMKEQLDTLQETHNETLAALEKARKARQAALTQLAEAKAGLAAPQPAPASPPSAAVGLLVADQDGSIVMLDPLARQLLRLPPGSLIGTPVNGAYTDPQWAQTVNALLSDAPDAPRRAHLSLNNGGQRLIEADLVTLVGADGAPDGLVITLRTEESSAERLEMLVSLVNEFRTPMTAITGYTDLLIKEQGGILTEMQLQFLQRVRANVEQLGQLLNDLIQLASPEAQQVELSPQPVDLISIIESAIAGLRGRFDERNLDVRMDFPPGLMPVRADRDSLYQIMLRLFSNAALCSQAGTAVRVVAELDTSDELPGVELIRISVSDTGGGIAPEDISKVFRRFYRADQPLIDGMGETGIGMAMVKALVEANHGRIWVESEPGKGSTFSLILPIAKEDALL